jgi:hypothetical protein
MTKRFRIPPSALVVRRPIATHNAEAQKFFDQGLIPVYGLDIHHSSIEPATSRTCA